METRAILILFFSIISFNSFSQGNTKITGFITDVADSTVLVSLFLENPNSLVSNSKNVSEVKTANGKFVFDFDIQEPRIVIVKLNHAHVFRPEATGILIEPNDSLDIEIPDSKKLGLMNIVIRGKGAEKTELQKSMWSAILPIYRADPRYSEQTLQYKFATVDRKLDAVDSAFYTFSGNVSDIGKEILRARQYHYVLDMLLISAMRSTSDSLRFLFESYIVNKNRIDPLLKDKVINYFPTHVLGNYILLSEFKNPVEQGGERFRANHPIEYTKFIIKHFGYNKPIKDYLLAIVANSVLKRDMFSSRSKQIYQIFKNEASLSSTFFNEVSEIYDYMESYLKPGLPFFNFELPDTTGKNHHLKDFRGKVLILDFWFNGCAGCAQMARALDSLEGYFNEDDVQFISINVDSKKIWLQGIEKYTSKNSLNLYTAEQKTEHPLIKYLNFSTYPKLVVIDRNGNLMPNPPDPRSKRSEFLKYIRLL